MGSVSVSQTSSGAQGRTRLGDSHRAPATNRARSPHPGILSTTASLPSEHRENHGISFPAGEHVVAGVTLGGDRPPGLIAQQTVVTPEACYCRAHGMPDQGGIGVPADAHVGIDVQVVNLLERTDG